MSRSERTLSGNYATRRLIAKDVSVSKKDAMMKEAKSKGKTYRFRGRGDRVGAAIEAMTDGSWRDAFNPDNPIIKKTRLTLREYDNAYNAIYRKYCQDLPLRYADRMSVYSKI
jgi:hypothetical protein|tara:strand:+ start:24 stop:362 length:339 start_codon:yes stop_codon:yes gene_type:complete